jgi:ABC-type branched-subunit amino acid transport system substrate-binding protein
LSTTRAPVGVAFALIALFGCGGSEPEQETVRIGLLLSYTGHLSADSINSERALLMAIQRANDAGGIGGRPLEVIARDARSDVRGVSDASGPARELLDSGVAVLIGPDTIDLAVTLRSTLLNSTVVLPSFAATSLGAKPPSWFVIGASTRRFACELQAQLQADGRRNPLLIMNEKEFPSSIGWVITNIYGIPKYVLDSDAPPSDVTLQPILSSSADSFVLAALPASGASLVYALSAVGKLGNPARWYLAPSLHTPAFLSSIPRGSLQGARGVAQGTAAAGAPGFRDAFAARWSDVPLDNAYAFYDAGAVVALALQRALTREGAIPTGTGLTPHILAVTDPAGMPVQWDQLPRGLELLQQGHEVRYDGLVGSVVFDSTGQTPAALTTWWTIGPGGFVDAPSASSCAP